MRISAGAMRAISERLAAWVGPTKIPSRPPAIQNASVLVASTAAVPQTNRPTSAIRIVRLAPSQSSIQAKAERAQPRGDVQQDAELDHLGHRHAEGAGGVDAAEREQRVEAVGVDHARDQEAHDRAVAAEVGEGPPQLAEPAAHRLAPRAGRCSAGRA